MRKPYEGMLNILFFNWPLYAVALLIALAGTSAVVIFSLQAWLNILLLMGVGGAVYFLVVSLAVSHLIYDRSPLYRWTWIKSQFVKIPQQIVNIHAGFDESSGAIHDLFPQAKLVILDFYNPERMTEPSIARARRHRPARLTGRPIDAGAIPLASGSCDAVFLLFAAHEIRNAQERLRFFREVSRIVSPGGTVLIVEHRRDLVNFLAFGPGFLHFYPQAEWLRLAAECNLRVACNYSMTPFVGVLVLNKGENTHAGEP
jgi:SAM-dependent methyltransferase